MDIAGQNGLAALHSVTNFACINCGQNGAFARAVLTGWRRDIFVRVPVVAPMDHCIRISYDPEAELDLFSRALPEALAKVRGGGRGR